MNAEKALENTGEERVSLALLSPSPSPAGGSFLSISERAVLKEQQKIATSLHPKAVRSTLCYVVGVAVFGGKTVFV